MVGVDDWEPKRAGRATGRVRRDRRSPAARRGRPTFAGAYYRADGAIMNPRPVQTPRPPDHHRRARPGHDAPRRAPGRHLEHACRSTRLFRRAGRRDAPAGGGDGRDRARRSDATRRRSARSYTMYDARGASARRDLRLLRVGLADSRRWPAGSSSSGWTSSSSTTRPTTASSPIFERIATDVLPRLRARSA